MLGEGVKEGEEERGRERSVKHFSQVGSLRVG